MNTINQVGNTGVTLNPATTAVQRGVQRKMIIGASMALLGAAAIFLSNTGSTNVPLNLAVSSIEGSIIVAFDTPTSASKNSQYRVFCAAVGGANPSARAEDDASPVVIAGLAAGDLYDCHASINADGVASKAVRIRVIGAD